MGTVLNFSLNKRQHELCSSSASTRKSSPTSRHGALLNAVKPEMLLDVADFHRLCQGYQRRVDHREVSLVEADRMQLWIDLDEDAPGARGDAQDRGRRLAHRSDADHQDFRPVSRDPQAVQHGAQPRVSSPSSPQTRFELGGIQLFQRRGDDPPQVALPALRATVFPIGPLGDRVLNFGADLEDGLVFYALLIRHWPEPRVPISQDIGVLRPTSREDVVRNADTILSMLQALRIPYGIDAESFTTHAPVRASAVLPVFVQHLPQLIPTQAIDFRKLGSGKRW